LAHQIADHLANAFVVEQDGDAACADIDGYAIPDYEGVGMIYFETIAVDKCNGERPERSSALKRSQCLFEVFGFH
jgi:hypothetical protein